MLLQSLVRARKSRLATQTLKVHVRREESSIERFQTAIRGALKCKAFEEQYAETQDAGEGVEYLQAALRGTLQPSQRLICQLHKSRQRREQEQLDFAKKIKRSNRTVVGRYISPRVKNLVKAPCRYYGSW